MSNYSKTTDFEAKDSLPTGDSGKIIRGAEFETEFDAISTAIATKADTAGPTFTGTLTFETISDGTIGVTAFVDEDNMASNSATLVPTQQSVKAYVDSQVTAQDLDFQADTGGALSIDLDSETMTFTGGTGIDTSGLGNAVTFAIDSTVATLTGTQTLTNKTLTSPDVNTPDIDGGTIDGTVIGGTTPAAVSATTVSATGNITVGGTVDGRDVATDGTKLDGIEAGATADQTAAEIRTLVDSATDSNVFTDADHSKLDGIEAGATGDQTNAEIRAAVEAATDSNVFTDADHSKLDGIEALADVTDTTNVTAAGALMDSELTNITAVKALNQGVATTDTPTFAGLATSANVTFGDNDKAVFGAGSDLQIYHDGSNSYVEDTGDGALFLKTNGAGVFLYSGSEALATFNLNGASNLYYDNGLKLSTTSTGIDVTGVVEATGYLAVEGTSGNTGAGTDRWIGGDGTAGTWFYNVPTGSNHYFAVNNSNKLAINSAGIDVTGTATMDGLTVTGTLGNWSIDSQGVIQTFTRPSANYIKASDALGSLAFQTGGANNRLNIASNGDISFYDSTGTSQALFWDASAESLGIGTTSPSDTLEVKASGNDDGIRLQGSGGANLVWLHQQSTDAATLRMYDGGNLNVLIGSNANANSYFNTGGNVGIGTSSPDTELSIALASTNITTLGQKGGIQLKSDSSTIGNGGEITWQAGAGNSERWCAISGHIVSNDASGARGDLVFATKPTSSATTLTEAMRIDSSGNLLVGTTDADPSNNSANSSADNGIASLASGEFVSAAYKATANTGSVGYFNRTGTDGAVLEFRKSGTSVGSIGTISGGISIGTGDTGLFFEPVSDEIRPFNTTTNASRDAAIDLGNSTKRFKDLYLSGGLRGDTTFKNNAGTTEYARFNSSGNLQVGHTNTDNSRVSVEATSVGVAMHFRRNTATYTTSAVVGSITCDSVSTGYNTSSDQRLKDNIVDAPSASDDIDAIQVRSFDWKADGSHQKYGMIAQEIQSVAPEAVTGDADSDDMMGVDYSKLVPMMLKEIQSLRARVAQLEGVN